MQTPRADNSMMSVSSRAYRGRCTSPAALLALCAMCCACACAALSENVSQFAHTINNDADTDLDAMGEPLAAGDMDSMLHWAIQNSDPDALRDAASSVRNGTEEAQRRSELREVMDALRKAPTEAQIMSAHLEAISTANQTEGHLIHSLQQLKELVRPIDNANDIKALGGIDVLVKTLESSSAAVKAEAAAVLAVAASNNVRFQEYVHSAFPDIVHRILKVIRDPVNLTAKQGLTAMGRFLRNDAAARLQFFKLDGLLVLQQLTTNPVLQIKAIDLLADLTALGLPETGLDVPFLNSTLETVAQQLTRPNPDWGLLESKCNLIQALLQSNPASAVALQRCNLQSALKGWLATLSKRVTKLKAAYEGTLDEDNSDQVALSEMIGLVGELLTCVTVQTLRTGDNIIPPKSTATQNDGLLTRQDTPVDNDQQMQETLQIGPAQVHASAPQRQAPMRDEL